MRELDKVIDQIQEIIPDEWSDLKSGLNSCKQSYYYTPPECMRDLWIRTHEILFSDFPYNFADLNDWQRQAANIWHGENVLNIINHNY